VVGLLARGCRPETAAAAEPPVLDCRTALLAPPDARRLPIWQPLAALLAACRDDPARFQAEVLGRTLWTRQLAVCAAAASSPNGGQRPFVWLLSGQRRPRGCRGFGAGRGGKRHVNRRTANAFALRCRLEPHRDGFVPFSCGGIPEWPNLRQELAELHSPAMEIQESQVKQLVEPKEALSARLHRSPDLLDALVMTFSFLEEG
jgi:hypothetical protein